VRFYDLLGDCRTPPPWRIGAPRQARLREHPPLVIKEAIKIGWAGK
jgi:hypothetical protein